MNISYTYRLTFTLIFIFSISPLIKAQPGRAVNWYFGISAGISFKTDIPEPLNDGIIGHINSSATISDLSGNLLFYVDRQYVRNKDHTIMPNGAGLDVYDYNHSQSIIIVPKPNSENTFYILSIGYDNYMMLQMHEVDMSQPEGKVTTINNIVYHEQMLFKITGVNHCNGKDVWIITQGHKTGKYYAFLISEDGVSTEPVISNFNHSGLESWDYGQIKFSPDGSRVVVPNENNHSNVMLYQFDNSTGKLYNEIIIDYTGSHDPFGSEFSPNGNFLYIASREGYCFPGTSYLYQYDVSEWNYSSINSSKTFIKSSSMNYGHLQVAVDGRIYMAGRTTDCDPTEHLHVINNPDVKGVGCNFVENSFYLNGKTSWQGLPNFIQSYFNKNTILEKDSVTFCADETIWLEANEFETYEWSTGEVSKGIEVSKEGWIFVKVVNENGCELSDSVYLTMNQKPRIQLPDKEVICKGDSLILNAGKFQSYSWNTGSSSSTIKVHEPGHYSVEVTDQNMCRAIDSTIVEISDISILLPDKINLCFNDSIELDPGEFRSYLWNNQFTHRKIWVKNNGTYSVKVINGAGCEDSLLIEVAVKDPLEINLGDSVNICSFDSTYFSVDNFSSYSWSTGDTISGIYASEEGQYNVEVKDEDGCSTIDSVYLNVEDCSCTLFVPNVFTPNNDGFNEVFELRTESNLDAIQLNIYNRYGKLIYNSDKLKPFWNGIVHNKRVPAGTYYWSVKYRCSNISEIFHSKGWVQIIF